MVWLSFAWLQHRERRSDVRLEQESGHGEALLDGSENTTLLKMHNLVSWIQRWPKLGAMRLSWPQSLTRKGELNKNELESVPSATTIAGKNESQPTTTKNTGI